MAYVHDMPGAMVPPGSRAEARRITEMTSYNIGVYNDGYATTRNTEDGPVEAWVEVFTIVAQERTGRNFFLADFGTEDRAEGELVVAALTLADSDPPAKPDSWVEGEQSYGSEAWASEAEYGLACFEADAYGEPRPRW